MKMMVYAALELWGTCGLHPVWWSLAFLRWPRGGAGSRNEPSWAGLQFHLMPHSSASICCSINLTGAITGTETSELLCVGQAHSRYSVIFLNIFMVI